MVTGNWDDRMYLLADDNTASNFVRRCSGLSSQKLVAVNSHTGLHACACFVGTSTVLIAGSRANDANVNLHDVQYVT